MGRWPHQAKPTSDGFVSRWRIVVWMAGLPGWVLVAQACVRSADRPCRRERTARVPRPRHTVSRTTPPAGPIGSVAGSRRGDSADNAPAEHTRFSTRDAEDARCRWPMARRTRAHTNRGQNRALWRPCGQRVSPWSTPTSDLQTVGRCCRVSRRGRGQPSPRSRSVASSWLGRSDTGDLLTGGAIGQAVT
jgi:hypothetical protein